jgi:hypothetical protein
MTTPSKPNTVLLKGHFNQTVVTKLPDAESLWHPTPVFSGPGGDFGQLTDNAGNVTRLIPLSDTDPRQIERTLQSITQSVGQARLLGVVMDPAKPAEVTYLTWLAMAKLCLGRFDELRPRLETNPISAFAFSGFMNGELPRYLRNSGQESELRLGDYELELAEIGAIAAKHLRTSPALKQLSKEADLPPDMNP